MRLYFAKGTISIAVAITLEELGIECDFHRLDFATGEQTRPEYLAINPKGRVPALDLDGTILTETGAILDYLAATHPDAGLVPQDPIAAAQMRAVMYYLASTMHPNHAHKMRGHRWADREDSWADMTAKVRQNMTENAAYVEAHCLGDLFVLGQTFSIADPYLFIVCTWLAGDGVDLQQFPRIRAFMAAMEDRASVKAVRTRDMMR